MRILSSRSRTELEALLIDPGADARVWRCLGPVPMPIPIPMPNSLRVLDGLGVAGVFDSSPPKKICVTCVSDEARLEGARRSGC